MNYHFDGQDAKEYGVHSAILLSNIKWWIAKNKANGTNFKDGKTWVYNSVQAWSELYPFLSAPQIRRALHKLVEAGVLVTANYNKIGFDKTHWYALADECSLDVTISSNDVTISSNGCDDSVKPIPVKETVKNSDNTPQKPPKKSFKTWSEEELRAEVENANHDNILTAEEVDDFVGYWRECDENGKTLIQKQKSWDTRRRMLNAIKCVYSKRRTQSPSPSGNPFLGA
jgi:hypothetical protein